MKPACLSHFGSTASSCFASACSRPRTRGLRSASSSAPARAFASAPLQPHSLALLEARCYSAKQDVAFSLFNAGAGDFCVANTKSSAFWPWFKRSQAPLWVHTPPSSALVSLPLSYLGDLGSSPRFHVFFVVAFIFTVTMTPWSHCHPHTQPRGPRPYRSV